MTGGPCLEVLDLAVELESGLAHVVVDSAQLLLAVAAHVEVESTV